MKSHNMIDENASFFAAATLTFTFFVELFDGECLRTLSKTGFSYYIVSNGRFFFHSNRIVWPGRICINAEYIPRNACICINEELTTIEMKNEYLLLMARTIDFWTNMQAWWILHGQTNEMLQKRIDCLLFIRYARWSLTKNDNWQYNNKYIKIVKIQQVRRFGIHAWIDHIFRFCFAQKKYSNFNNNTNIYIFYCYYC